MSEEEEYDWGLGMQALHYFNRATKDCATRCGALKLQTPLGEQEIECLKNCSVYHAGSTSATQRYLKEFSDRHYLK